MFSPVVLHTVSSLFLFSLVLVSFEPRQLFLLFIKIHLKSLPEFSDGTLWFSSAAKNMTVTLLKHKARSNFNKLFEGLEMEWMKSFDVLHHFLQSTTREITSKSVFDIVATKLGSMP